MSTDSGCQHKGKIESMLGHVATHRSTETPRSLRVCVYSSGDMYHSLDAPCNQTIEQEFLGFVH